MPHWLRLRILFFPLLLGFPCVATLGARREQTNLATVCLYIDIVRQWRDRPLAAKCANGSLASVAPPLCQILPFHRHGAEACDGQLLLALIALV